MLTDPRCPECGERVGASAVECFQCGAEFDAPVDGHEGADAERSGNGEGDRRGRGDPTEDGRRETGSGLVARLLDPDGFLDDSLTLAIAVGVALVCAVVALFVFGAVAGGGVGLLAALVALVGLLAWLGRQYSVLGAVRGGCYAVAAALVALPLIALTDAAKGGTFGGQVILFVIGEVLFGIVALVLVGIGYAAGKRRPDPRSDDAAGAGADEEEAREGVGSVVQRE